MLDSKPGNVTNTPATMNGDHEQQERAFDDDPVNLGVPPDMGLPEPLMNNLTKKEQWLFKAMARCRQNDLWHTQSIKTLESRFNELMKRQKADEAWRIVFASRWSIITWLGGSVISMLVVEVCRRLFHIAAP